MTGGGFAFIRLVDKTEKTAGDNHPAVFFILRNYKVKNEAIDRGAVDRFEGSINN